MPRTCACSAITNPAIGRPAGAAAATASATATASSCVRRNSEKRQDDEDSC